MVDAQLVSFLREAAGKTFELRTFDCGLWLADWYMVKTGRPDPVAEFRGTHDGQLWNHAQNITAKLGLPKVNKYSAGDIGLVKVGNVIKGAIFSLNGWVTLCEQGGLDRVPVSAVICAWRII